MKILPSWGGQYFIYEKEEKQAIYKFDEYNPGYGLLTSEVADADLLSLAWAKENIRMDTRGDVRGTEESRSHRYFLRSQGRYLAENDFGMRAWDDQTNEMVVPDVCKISPLIRTIKQQIVRIVENLQIYFDVTFTERINAASENTRRNFLESHGIQENVGGTTNAITRPRQDGQPVTNEAAQEERQEKISESYKIRDEARAQATRESIKIMRADLEHNTRDSELLLTGVCSNRVLRQLKFKYEAIAKKYGLCSKDAIRDYENFSRNSRRLETVFTEPSEEERQGTTIDFVTSEFYDKPVIFGKLDRQKVLAQVNEGVHGVLAFRAAKADPETTDLIERYRSDKGENSPNYYSDAEIYDFLKALGPERAKAIVTANHVETTRLIKGWKLLNKLGFDVSKMDSNKLKKQLLEANNIIEHDLWQYIEHREQPRIEAARKRLGARAEGKTWEEKIGARASRDLFFECKRMRWMARQVFSKTPNRDVNDKFYNYGIDWRKYDLSGLDIPDEKVEECLNKNINLISALLGQNKNQFDYSNGSQTEEYGNPATLNLIISALDHQQDLRGVALARDKQRYLKGVIEGHEGDDIAFAIADWPGELHTAISQEEIKMYYEYADDYVLRDPNGLLRYAQWRASAEGRDWQKIFAENPESKSDLDFRICIAGQTEEIRGWYKDAAEYTGGTVMQDYLLRFNATRDAGGQMADWHDVLFWVPNIKNLDPKEAKNILNSIQTMDENQEFVKFLPRYRKERDPLLSNGEIQSLRELKKRVLGIEANIDLTGLSPEIIDIISAPGFDLGSLERLKKRPDFKALVEGQLDTKQPFKPHSRIFAGRSLTDALKEGLGSQKMKIRGTAKDVKGLFFALKQMIKDRKIGEKQMEVTDLFGSIPIELEEDIIHMLQEQKVDVGPLVEAQVHAKSDPEGWVCGNYTDCCMPFGDHKNDDYMFNPSTQYFTIKYNGRIVAQSVVIDGKNNADNSDVVILDNIEVANNYKNLSPLLAQAYQKFWAEYTSRQVKVGTGYSDLIPPGGKLELNTFQPKTHVVYSDARGGMIYDLPKIRGVESLDEAVTFANITERDAGLVAKLEAVIYPQGMTQGKAHMEDILRKQRELEVPGAASSFVIRSGKEAAGYLLILPEESEVDGGQAAHVYDMAILPSFQGKGLARKMIDHVLDIATAYNMPIEAEARASTSYAMLMNERVRHLFESRGFVLTHNEKKEKYLGGEDFYFVRFENKGAPAQEE